MRRGVAAFVLRWLERACLIAGLACGVSLYTNWRDATAYQLEAKNEINASHAVKDDHQVVGMLSIPRVDLSAAVIEGDDDRTLGVAVGHLPDTPLPWEPGNSGLAGHRDTFFRPLRRVREGDEVSLATRRGVLRYRVTSITIVKPDDLSVLDSAPEAQLTLITCYPFGYVGPAPKRFVVQAARVGSVAESPVAPTQPRYTFHTSAARLGK